MTTPTTAPADPVKILRSKEGILDAIEDLEAAQEAIGDINDAVFHELVRVSRELRHLVESY